MWVAISLIIGASITAALISRAVSKKNSNEEVSASQSATPEISNETPSRERKRTNSSERTKKLDEQEEQEEMPHEQSNDEENSFDETLEELKAAIRDFIETIRSLNDADINSVINDEIENMDLNSDDWLEDEQNEECKKIIGEVISSKFKSYCNSVVNSANDLIDDLNNGVDSQEVERRFSLLREPSLDNVIHNNEQLIKEIYSKYRAYCNVIDHDEFENLSKESQEECKKLFLYIKDESVSIGEFNDFCDELFYSRLNEENKVVETEVDLGDTEYVQGYEYEEGKDDLAIAKEELLNKLDSKFKNNNTILNEKKIRDIISEFFKPENIAEEEKNKFIDEIYEKIEDEHEVLYKAIEDMIFRLQNDEIDIIVVNQIESEYNNLPNLDEVLNSLVLRALEEINNKKNTKEEYISHLNGLDVEKLVKERLKDVEIVEGGKEIVEHSLVKLFNEIKDRNIKKVNKGEAYVEFNEEWLNSDKCQQVIDLTITKVSLIKDLSDKVSTVLDKINVSVDDEIDLVDSIKNVFEDLENKVVNNYNLKMFKGAVDDASREIDSKIQQYVKDNKIEQKIKDVESTAQRDIANLKEDTTRKLFALNRGLRGEIKELKKGVDGKVSYDDLNEVKETLNTVAAEFYLHSEDMSNMSNIVIANLVSIFESLKNVENLPREVESLKELVNEELERRKTVELEYDEKLAELVKDIAQVDEKTDVKVADLKKDTTRKLFALNRGLRGEIKDLENVIEEKTDAKIANLKEDMTRKLFALNRGLRGEIKELKKGVDGKVSYDDLNEVKETLNTVAAEFYLHSEDMSNMSNIVIANLVSIFESLKNVENLPREVEILKNSLKEEIIRRESKELNYDATISEVKGSLVNLQESVNKVNDRWAQKANSITVAALTKQVNLLKDKIKNLSIVDQKKVMEKVELLEKSVDDRVDTKVKESMDDFKKEISKAMEEEINVFVNDIEEYINSNGDVKKKAILNGLKDELVTATKGNADITSLIKIAFKLNKLELSINNVDEVTVKQSIKDEIANYSAILEKQIDKVLSSKKYKDEQKKIIKEEIDKLISNQEKMDLKKIEELIAKIIEKAEIHIPRNPK